MLTSLETFVSPGSRPFCGSVSVALPHVLLMDEYRCVENIKGGKGEQCVVS